MKKTFILLCLSVFLLFSTTACGPSTTVGLDDSESEVLALIGDDVQVVEESEWANIVPELAAHIGEFDGQVFQLEGVLRRDGDQPYVYRTLVNGDSKTECALPLRYLQKEIEEGAFVRVTGAVNAGELNGETVNYLEVIAIEVLSSGGASELPWSGSVHNH